MSSVSVGRYKMTRVKKVKKRPAGIGMSIITLFILAQTVYANQDVPPAVPLDAVHAEELLLAEPVNAGHNAHSSSAQQDQDLKREKPAVKLENKKQGFLARFFDRLFNPPTKDGKESKSMQSGGQEIRQSESKTIKQDSNKNTSPPINNLVSMKSFDPVIPEGRAFYVIELFTTQACPFCPKADALMQTYTNMSYVIALSCHVDYFDVQQGSLSHPACSSRQERYETIFDETPKYTPQMVINGRYDAVGYLNDKIAQAFEKAHAQPVDLLVVKPLETTKERPPAYQVQLPDFVEGSYNLWAIAYDRPHHITVHDGANKGRDMVYYNAVSKAEFLGSWNGQSRLIEFAFAPPVKAKGFSFLVQDVQTGSILMAGKNE